MAEKEILYVTYKDEKTEEGLSYAIYLAGQISAGLRIVLLNRNGSDEKIGDVMAAVHSADAGDIAASESFVPDRDEDGNKTASIYTYLMDKCEEEGVKVNIHTAPSGTVKAVKDYLKFRKVEMVVLSPSVSKSGIIKSLAKISPTPVVTMAR